MVLRKPASNFRCRVHRPPHHSRSHQYPLWHLLNMTKYRSPTKKARICRDKAAGLSDGHIAKKFGIHRTTVKRIFDSCAKTEDYYTIKPKSGRPRLFTSNDTRRAARLLAQGKAHDVADLQRKYFPEINAETIRTRLCTCGLKAYVRRPKPLLTEAHKKRRFEWQKLMFIGYQRTGSQSSSQTNLNSIVLSQMVVNGVGGSVGKISMHATPRRW